MTTLALILAMAGPPPAAAELTRVSVVVDSRTWQDIRASTFLPVGFGPGHLAGKEQVRLCGRLTCLVLIPEDTAAGRVAGEVVLGVTPVTGSALGERLAQDTLAPLVEIVPPPPLPDPDIASSDLPIMYYLESLTIAFSDANLRRLDPLMRSAGGEVYREGEGLVVTFPNQTLRLVPDFRRAGIERLTWRLRAEASGNPTYRFGGSSRLRFGPGRTATWTF